MPTSPIRVFVIDDHVLYRDSMVALLRAEKDLDVVGQGSSVEETKPRLAECKPDVVLCEVTLPGQGGLDLLHEVPALSPQSRTIAISDNEIETDIVEAMRRGARGFVDKQCPVDLFLKCIRKVHTGEIWLSGRLTDAVLHAFGSQQTPNKLDGKAELSRREMEVIQLVIQGYKNRDIAQKLFISEKTVKNHLSAIFNKLGVADRLELTLYAFERRLFPPE
jgi:two-component system, NarL family, nitrate/nitrite response regulator NarL